MDLDLDNLKRLAEAPASTAGWSFDLAMEKFHAAANPYTVLALINRVRELEAHAGYEQWRAEFDALRARIAELEGAANRFVSAVEATEPGMNNLAAFGTIHGFAYSGPSYGGEKAALRKLLGPLPEVQG